MIDCGTEAAGVFGQSILVLDRYFLSVPALRRIIEWNSRPDQKNTLEIVTKAKLKCTAYTKPVIPEGRRRGRPRKKGDSVKVFSLFDSHEDEFTQTSVYMYGEKKDVSFYAIDLLWGQGLYQEIRFVLVRYDGLKSVLVSTDLSLSPVQIIEIYAHRAKIEESFREFKQTFGGFSYHFWTKALPKLNHCAKSGDPDPLSGVEDEDARRRILNNIKAIEGFVLFAGIAMGVLQLLSLSDEFNETIRKSRYLRTPSRENPSEATVMYYLRRKIFLLMLNNPDSPITKIIRAKQEKKTGTRLKKTG